jgi:hypothetical protein
MYFQTNGYALTLSQKIFDSFAKRVYINKHDIQMLQRFKNDLSNIRFISNTTLKFIGPAFTLGLTCEIVEDNTQSNGSLRFGDKHPTQTILATENILPSKRIENLILITEGGEYLSL